MTPRVAEHSEDLGAAESADSAGWIGIGGGIVGDGQSGCTDITVSPLYVPCPQGTGTEGQRTIRTDRTCGSWKAGKCREPGGNPEGEAGKKTGGIGGRQIEEEECVEKRRMMAEVTGGGRSIGSGETLKVNRDNRKRRKSRRRSKVDTEAHGGARGRSVPERPKSRSSREGRKRESAWPHGRKLAEKSFLGPEPRAGSRSDVGWGIEKESGKRKASRKFRSGKRRIGRPEYRPSWMENDLKQVKVVRERDRNLRPRPRDTGGGKRKKPRMGEGKKVKMGSLPHRRVRTWVREHASRNRTEKEVGKLPHCRVWTRVRDRASRNWTEGKNVEGDQGHSIEAEENSAEGQDQRWRTRIGEWNEKSRSLMDQYSISEARRFGVGVAATSERWPRRPQTPQTHQMKCKQGAAQPKCIG
ncbi:hypothetical protein DFH06DRAFT_1122842 [Mycena polygramma]|nr:hypothetical protein DFH06DRAFT_1122842 [Mycena polygramma]